MGGKRLVLSFGAQAFGLAELGVAHFDLGQSVVLIQGDGHGHRAHEAFHGSCCGFPLSSRCIGGGRGLGRGGCLGGSRSLSGCLLAGRIHQLLLVGAVDGVHNRCGGAGGAGERINAFHAQGQLLAGELLDKGRILGSGAVAIGFLELVIPDGECGDGAVILDGDKHGHGARKALFAGGIAGAFRSRRRHDHLVFKGLVDGIHHGHTGARCTGQGIDIVDGDGQALANELLGESGVLGAGAISVGFGKLVVANGQGADGAVVLHSDQHGDRAGKALGAGGIGGSLSSACVRLRVQVGIHLGRHCVDGANHRIGGLGGGGDGIDGVVTPILR